MANIRKGSKTVIKEDTFGIPIGTEIRVAEYDDTAVTVFYEALADGIDASGARTQSQAIRYATLTHEQWDAQAKAPKKATK